MLQRMYSALGREARLQGRADRLSRRRAGGDQVGDAAAQRRGRLRLGQDRERRPPAGPHQPLRQRGAAAHVVRQRLGLSGGRRRHRHRRRRQGPQDRHLPGVGLGRAARQHDRFGGAHHPSADRRRRRLPERAQPAQEPRDGDEDAESAAVRTRTRRSAKPPPPTSRPARPTSAGATRSGRTSCSPTSWSRTSGPASPRPRQATSSTAPSTRSWRRR